MAALRSEGYPVASEGSVYPLLRRLEDEGLIECYLQASTGGLARKYYRITEEGAGALRAWASRTFEFHDIARRIIATRVEGVDVDQAGQTL